LRSQAVSISDVFVRPSTRKKQLDLDIEVTGKPSSNVADVTARLLDESGKEEKQFTAQVNMLDSDRQVVTVSFPWPNPRLWDFGKPNLYTLQLTVKGGDLNGEVTQTFGFREFWVQGRRFI